MLAGCSMLPWAEMSDEEAGEKYLAAICPSNSALERWSEAHSAYVDDPTAGFAGAIEAAAGVRDSAQAAIWPALRPPTNTTAPTGSKTPTVAQPKRFEAALVSRQTQQAPAASKSKLRRV